MKFACLFILIILISCKRTPQKYNSRFNHNPIYIYDSCHFFKTINVTNDTAIIKSYFIGYPLQENKYGLYNLDYCISKKNLNLEEYYSEKIRNSESIFVKHKDSLKSLKYVNALLFENQKYINYFWKEIPKMINGDALKVYFIEPHGKDSLIFRRVYRNFDESDRTISSK